MMFTKLPQKGSQTEDQRGELNRLRTRLVAVLVMILVLAVVGMSSKSHQSSFVSSSQQRQERVNVFRDRTIARSQEGLKRFIHNDCARVRRDWHDLTQEERKLYLDAFWEMYKRGYVAMWFKDHMEGAVHGNPDFLPWHRIFTFEFENRIRALGGRFRCFALPYWDWTRMAGKPIAANPIWKQGLGGDGVLSASDLAYYNKTGKYRRHSSLKVPGGCVFDGRFGKSTGYRTTAGDCLRRLFRKGKYFYQSTEQTLYGVEQRQIYARFHQEFSGWHYPIHLATRNENVASQEPLFFLIHSYVDLVWALRSDCHGYDLMTNWRTNEEIFDGDLLHSKLHFPYIANHPWSMAYHVQITPALSLNFPQFGIQYDFSDMWQRTKMQLSSCQFSYFQLRAPKALPRGGVRISDGVIAMSACKRAFADCDMKMVLRGCGGTAKKMTQFLKVLRQPITKDMDSCVWRWKVALHNWVVHKGRDAMELCSGKPNPVCPFLY